MNIYEFLLNKVDEVWSGTYEHPKGYKRVRKYVFFTALAHALIITLTTALFYWVFGIFGAMFSFLFFIYHSRLNSNIGMIDIKERYEEEKNNAKDIVERAIKNKGMEV